LSAPRRPKAQRRGGVRAQQRARSGECEGPHRCARVCCAIAEQKIMAA
jgi:hypothetical protein